MRCSFCATGKGGFARNLLAHEIVDQVLTVQQQFGTRVSNVGVAPPPSPSHLWSLSTYACTCVGPSHSEGLVCATPPAAYVAGL